MMDVERRGAAATPLVDAKRDASGEKATYVHQTILYALENFGAGCPLSGGVRPGYRRLARPVSE